MPKRWKPRRLPSSQLTMLTDEEVAPKACVTIETQRIADGLREPRIDRTRSRRRKSTGSTATLMVS